MHAIALREAIAATIPLAEAAHLDPDPQHPAMGNLVQSLVSGSAFTADYTQQVAAQFGTLPQRATVERGGRYAADTQLRNDKRIITVGAFLFVTPEETRDTHDTRYPLPLNRDVLSGMQQHLSSKFTLEFRFPGQLMSVEDVFEIPQVTRQRFASRLEHDPKATLDGRQVAVTDRSPRSLVIPGIAIASNPLPVPSHTFWPTMEVFEFDNLIHPVPQGLKVVGVSVYCLTVGTEHWLSMQRQFQFEKFLKSLGDDNPVLGLCHTPGHEHVNVRAKNRQGQMRSHYWPDPWAEGIVGMLAAVAEARSVFPGLRTEIVGRSAYPTWRPSTRYDTDDAWVY